MLKRHFFFQDMKRTEVSLNFLHQHYWNMWGWGLLCRGSPCDHPSHTIIGTIDRLIVMVHPNGGELCEVR
jgi:hypothetical protein